MVTSFEQACGINHGSKIFFRKNMFISVPLEKVIVGTLSLTSTPNPIIPHTGESNLMINVKFSYYTSYQSFAESFPNKIHRGLGTRNTSYLANTSVKDSCLLLFIYQENKEKGLKKAYSHHWTTLKPEKIGNREKKGE